MIFCAAELVALSRTPKAAKQDIRPPRPSSTPPRLQTVVREKKNNNNRRLLFDSGASTSRSNEGSTGATSQLEQDPLWNQYLQSEIQKNNVKTELMRLEIEIKKEELRKIKEDQGQGSTFV